jgi:hypothetical protein
MNDWVRMNGCTEVFLQETPELELLSAGLTAELVDGQVLQGHVFIHLPASVYFSSVLDSLIPDLEKFFKNKT